jgi:uncharacterized membrane protein YdjX (TVP38/TMEM64 family)
MSRRQLYYLLAGLALLVAAFFLREPMVAGLEQLQLWMSSLGAWGPPVFIALCALAVLLFLPVSPFLLGAGVLFGFWLGSLYAGIGYTAGSLIGFLIARGGGRHRLKSWIARSPRFRAIDYAIHTGGLRTAFLLRMSPILPASIQSYAFGLTALRFRHYLVASIATIPTVFMYVYYGHALSRIAATGSAGGISAAPTRYALLIAGLLVTVVATVFLSLRARAELAARGLIAGGAASSDEPPGAGEPPDRKGAA